MGKAARQGLHRRRQSRCPQPALHGAMVATKHIPILKAFHERLIAAGKVTSRRVV
jgi:hypothetical protein